MDIEYHFFLKFAISSEDFWPELRKNLSTRVFVDSTSLQNICDNRDRELLSRSKAYDLGEGESTVFVRRDTKASYFLVWVKKENDQVHGVVFGEQTRKKTIQSLIKNDTQIKQFLPHLKPYLASNFNPQTAFALLLCIRLVRGVASHLDGMVDVMT